MIFYLMNEIGKFLVIVGILLVVAGTLIWSGVGRGWIGRLPGDVHYSRGDFHFYFPIATCFIVSALITLILWLLRK